MTEYVNDIGIPYPIYKAICNDPYSKGEGVDYSVTQLFDGAKKIYGDILCKEQGTRMLISETLELFDGSMFHDGVEHRLKDDPEFITEKRLKLQININGKPVIISGAFDCYCLVDKCLYDYKTCKPGGWKMRHKKMHAYSQQVNIYRLMMKLNAIAEPASLAIIFCNKGWNQLDAYTPGYPPAQYMLEPVEMLPTDEVIQLIKQKVIELESYRNTPYDAIPYCNEIQCWEDEPTWKVCKYQKDGSKPLRPKAVPKGRRTTFEAAEELLRTKGSGYFIQEEGGMPKRCLKYCKAGKAGICKKPAEYLAERAGLTAEEAPEHTLL